MHRSLLIAASLFASSLVFAEHCPSIEAIHTNQAQAWKAYDCEDDKPLSAQRLSEFKKNVEAFALAEWVQTKSTEGNIHCYYRSKNGSDLDAYLSKRHYRPSNYKDYWYQVSGAMQCAAGGDKCEFQLLNEHKQLAKQPVNKEIHGEAARHS